MLDFFTVFNWLLVLVLYRMLKTLCKTLKDVQNRAEKVEKQLPILRSSQGLFHTFHKFSTFSVKSPFYKTE